MRNRAARPERPPTSCTRRSRSATMRAFAALRGSAGGAALRARLTPECEDAFKAHDRSSAGRGNEPSLTFRRAGDVAHTCCGISCTRAARSADVEWESFWGFRVPIAHWVMFESHEPRSRCVQGLFGGIHEDLPFAAREIDAVALPTATARGQCRSVVDYFKRFVRESLVAANVTEADADAWFAAHESDWLEEYLYDGAAEA